jgi:hypothetical protein
MGQVSREVMMDGLPVDMEEENIFQTIDMIGIPEFSGDLFAQE